MNVRNRIDKLEEQAENFQERMDDRNSDQDEVARMLHSIGRKNLAGILRMVNGKTRGLPSERP